MPKVITGPEYDLVFTYPCGGYITCGGEDTGAFLQGDSYYELESELETLWKQVRNHRIGKQKACDIQDSILSEYTPEA
jgi:hypothetical protein